MKKLSKKQEKTFVFLIIVWAVLTLTQMKTDEKLDMVMPLEEREQQILENINAMEKTFNEATFEKETKKYTLTESDSKLVENILKELTSEGEKAEIKWAGIRGGNIALSKFIQTTLGDGYTLEWIHPTQKGVVIMKIKDGEVLYDINQKKIDNIEKKTKPVQEKKKTELNKNLATKEKILAVYTGMIKVAYKVVDIPMKLAPTIETVSYWTLSEEERVELWLYKIEHHSIVFDEVIYDEKKKIFTRFESDPEYAVAYKETIEGEGGEEYWEDVREKSILASNEMKDFFGKGYTMIIMDPENHNKKILEISDGKIKYDAYE